MNHRSSLRLVAIGHCPNTTKPIGKLVSRSFDLVYLRNRLSNSLSSFYSAGSNKIFGQSKFEFWTRLNFWAFRTVQRRYNAVEDDRYQHPFCSQISNQDRISKRVFQLRFRTRLFEVEKSLTLSKSISLRELLSLWWVGQIGFLAAKWSLIIIRLVTQRWTIISSRSYSGSWSEAEGWQRNSMNGSWPPLNFCSYKIYNVSISFCCPA